jgi:RHS repeat-associated protein
MASSATSCGGATNAISYAYDKVSNRTQEVRAGSVGNTGTIDSSYNAADQLTSTTKSGNSTNYGYDANGNQTSAGSRSFSYDLADRLTSTSSGGTSTSYSYDGDDRRLSSTTSGGADLRYSWDPLADSGIPELALERTSTGSLVRRYLDGLSGALAYTSSAGTYSYHHDPLGNVTDVTDATGAAQWKYEYEPYGAQRTATNVSGNAPENRLRLTGQYLDPESSNYHLRARQYDPASGRFDGLDPIDNPATSAYDGAYLYVDGRPTILIDPLGLCGFSFSWKNAKDCGSVAKETFHTAVDGVADAVPDRLKKAVKTEAKAVALGGKIVGNATAGATDAATLGLSTKGLNKVGIHPDTHSVAFKIGEYGTDAAMVAAGGAGIAKVGLRVALKVAERRAARCAAEDGMNVILDTNAVFNRPGVEAALRAGEAPVVTGTTRAELANLVASGKVGMPRYAAELKTIPDVMDVDLRINIRGAMRPGQRGLFGDGAIGATAVRTGSPVITADRNFASALESLGVEVRIP